MELKLNESRLPKNKGETWEWYTAKVGKLAYIHVHSRTDIGWTWFIETVATEMGTRNRYDTRDEAYLSARVYLRGVIAQTLEEMSGNVK